MRRPLIVGNWKMNLDLAGVRSLISGLRAGLDAFRGADLAVCPPFVYLLPTAKALDGSPMRLGAQNLYHEASGAFTGEVSAAMLSDAGCNYVIIGHSERRHTIGHHEDDAMVNQKLHAALAAKLTPIVCVGETLEERKANKTHSVLAFQTLAALVGVAADAARSIVIAYEPVWAIGTGQNATPEQAQDAHRHIRGLLRSSLGSVADEIRILYGGSVKPDNAAAIGAQPDVDGGLIGGASLKADSFTAIAQAMSAAR